MKPFEIEVINALRELEVPANLLGYEFIKSAMNHLHDNPQSLYSITKELYPAVAEKHKTTPSRVERAIRHALETCYSDFITQKKVLGTSRELTNGEFLATLHEVIKLKLATEQVSNVVIATQTRGEKVGNALRSVLSSIETGEDGKANELTQGI